MKKILFTLSLGFLLIGCNSKFDSTEIKNGMTTGKFIWLRSDLKRDNSKHINSINFDKDSSFVIDCWLAECGAYQLRGKYGEIEKFNLNKEMENNYEFQRQFPWFGEETYYKIPLNFEGAISANCQWNLLTLTHYITNDPNDNATINFYFYPFALICKNTEANTWDLHLTTKYRIYPGSSNEKWENKNWQFMVEKN